MVLAVVVHLDAVAVEVEEVLVVEDAVVAGETMMMPTRTVSVVEVAAAATIGVIIEVMVSKIMTMMAPLGVVEVVDAAVALVETEVTDVVAVEVVAAVAMVSEAEMVLAMNSPRAVVKEKKKNHLVRHIFRKKQTMLNYRTLA